MEIMNELFLNQIAMDIKSHLPTILTFIGGALTIVGVAWASIRNSETQKQLQEISSNALDQITGGDSWCYLESGFMQRQGEVVSHDYIPLQFIFEGTIPMYDISVVINKSVPYGLSREPWLKKNVGTLTKTQLSTWLFKLPIPKKERTDYFIEITSRNGQIFQHLIYIKKDETTWLTGTKVVRCKAVDNLTFRFYTLYEYVPEGFPEPPKFFKYGS